MENVTFPAVIEKYLSAKSSHAVDEVLACFTEDATVWDNGEDLEIHGIAEIREWLAGTVAGYNLTSEVVGRGKNGDEYVAKVVVSGDFPGSPYEFAHRFKLRDDKIAELAIDPIGSLAP